MRPALWFGLPAFAVALAACSSAARAPILSTPTRFDSACGSRQVRYTGLMSVITSTDDKAIAGVDPTDTEVHAEVHARGGAIAYWNDERLALPRVAGQLGETDGYVRLRAAAVPTAAPNSPTRRIELLLRDHRRFRWVALRAFDRQDVCVEGRREM
ncbi:MAG: hypothetical protein ABI346_04640 [Candidatus Baltobacteraceae bacterium]